MRRMLWNVLGLGMVGCASMPANGAGSDRVMTVACSKPGEALVARTRELLVQGGWTVTKVVVEPPETEASRAAVYVGVGENIIANGPYRFDMTYLAGQVRILVQTVRVQPDGRAIPAIIHDERSPEADLRNFLPVVVGIREFCK